jgi:hypothetical protein
MVKRRKGKAVDEALLELASDIKVKNVVEHGFHTVRE